MPTPIEMPSPLPVNTKKFDLLFNQDITPVGGGFMQTIERQFPIWGATYTTPPLRKGRASTFQGFLDTLYGAEGVFLAFDPRRARPYLYETGTDSPWEATPGTPPVTVASDPSIRTLLMSGWANGIGLMPGDYISFLQDNAWRLFRVTEQCSSSGGNMNPFVVPRPTNVVAGCSVRLIKPCCAMKIIGAVDKQDRVDDLGPVFTFNAIQFIDRSGE